jgi:NADPH-dependent curcumin reductase CurA
MAQKEELLIDSVSTRKSLKQQGCSEETIYEYIQKDIFSRKVGDIYSVDAGSPGIGKFVYRITKVKNGKVFGIYLPDKSTVSILEPEDCI